MDSFIFTSSVLSVETISGFFLNPPRRCLVSWEDGSASTRGPALRSSLCTPNHTLKSRPRCTWLESRGGLYPTFPFRNSPGKHGASTTRCKKCRRTTFLFYVIMYVWGEGFNLHFLCHNIQINQCFQVVTLIPISPSPEYPPWPHEGNK